MVTYYRPPLRNDSLHSPLLENGPIWKYIWNDVDGAELGRENCHMAGSGRATRRKPITLLPWYYIILLRQSWNADVHLFLKSFWLSPLKMAHQKKRIIEEHNIFQFLERLEFCFPLVYKNTTTSFVYINLLVMQRLPVFWRTIRLLLACTSIFQLIKQTYVKPPLCPVEA